MTKEEALLKLREIVAEAIEQFMLQQIDPEVGERVWGSAEMANSLLRSLPEWVKVDTREPTTAELVHLVGSGYWTIAKQGADFARAQFVSIREIVK